MTNPVSRIPTPAPTKLKQELMELGEQDQAAVAAAAIQEIGPAATADLVTAALGTLPSDKQHELLDELQPEQPVTNWIWRTIVATFSLVLVVATLALIGAVFMELDNAALQMLLTIFTTTGGILAGFISGRAATSRGRI